MQVKDIMTHTVEIISADASICDAAGKMKAMDIGALPVSVDTHVVGMLTDRDIVLRVVAEGRDPLRTPVREAMTPDIITCFEDQDIYEVAEIMKQHQIRRILVLSEDNIPCGILSLGDIAVHAGNVGLVEEMARHVSEPVHSW